ncbi:MAG: EsaB/YukD family protein [Clostridiales bacterium]|nr:EsaB/YukD family protein [Clostridiales bacterium]
MDEKAVVKFVNHTSGFEIDIEVPLDITAQDLFVALNRGLKLGVNENDRYNYFLKADKPLAFLSGTETLDKFGVRNGTVINFVRGDYNG